MLRTLSSFLQTIAMLSKLLFFFSRKCSCFWCWLWPSFSDQISSFPTEKTCIREKILRTTSKPESVKFQSTYYFRIWTVRNLADLKSGLTSSCLVKYFIMGNRTGRFVTTLTSAWRSFMLENSSLENIDLHLLKPTSSVSRHLMTHDFLRNQTVNDREV